MKVPAQLCLLPPQILATRSSETVLRSRNLRSVPEVPPEKPGADRAY